MILIAFGANRPGPAGSPRQTYAACLAQLRNKGIFPLVWSGLYRSRAVGAAQGWFVNGIIRADAVCGPARLLARLHGIERIHRRERPFPHAPRMLDLDLIDYHGRIIAPPGGPPALTLPHPHAHRRIFVLQPLADIAPEWRHPQSGRSLQQMLLPLRRSGKISK